MIALLNDAGDAWAAWLLPALLQNTVFLGLVFLALHLLSDASARVRAAVATIGLVKLAVPPFLTVRLGEALVERPGADGASTLLFPFGTAETMPAAWSGATGGLSLPAALMIAWGSLVLARLGWVALQTLQLAWSVRGGVLLPPEAVPAEVRRRGVAVRRVDAIALPLTLGPWPRTIHVPGDWDRWPADHRRAALRHELAHIVRRDGLVQFVELVVQAAWFYHPLVLLLVRRLRTWREMACDDAAVAPDARARLDYSRFLADLAVRAPASALAAGSASTLSRGRSELLSRVAHQIREGTMRPVPRSRVIAVAAALLLAALPLSLVLADAPPAPPAKPAEPAPEAAPVPESEPAPEADAAVAPTAEPAPETEVPAPPPPRGEKLVPPKPPKRPHVLLEIGTEEMRVDGRPVESTALRDVLLESARMAGADPLIALDADGGVPMGKLHEVQQLLEETGLTDVVYKGKTGRALAMALPSGAAEAKLERLPAAFVLDVAVDGVGVVTVAGKPVKGHELARVVAGELKNEEHLVVALHTHTDTKYGAMVQVLGSLEEAGATRIAIRDPGS